MYKRKVRKIKKKPVIILCSTIIFIILVIIGINMGINYYKKINSNEYKLEQIGYTLEDVNIIITLDQDKIDNILSREYNKLIPKLIKEKYFMWNNLDKYISYYEETKDDNFSHLIALVNVYANYDYYDEDIVHDTDLSKENLILVNKYHKLNSDFVPTEITSIPSTYAYANNQASKETLDAFKNMWAAAKAEGLTLIVNSSYRDYESQEQVWNKYANIYGEEYADSIAARAGFSEHQTGLALDIITYGANGSNFDETEEFAWLSKNAYKYGFILRYPNGKEDITGYSYESWHYRYVGISAAKEIHEMGITYDEYYAYYVGE